MEYVYPDYYRQFTCIGGKCPDTCCAGWEIVIDDKTLEKYKKYPGGFGNRLRNSINFKRKSFKQYDRRCAFLNEENLCDIYTEAGEKLFCKTCRQYPRHEEEYENVRELSLSLSCPEAARMILSQDRQNLIYDEKKGHSEDYGDFDELLFSQLLDGRDAFWKLIENENVPMAVRMMQMLSMGHHLQKNISEGQLFGLENIYDHYLSEGAANRMNVYLKEKWEKPGSRYHVMKGMFSCLHKLEALSADWPGKVRHYEKILFSGGRKKYEALHQYRMPDKIAEQLLSYFIYVYFAGAVYDGMPYSKVKLAVISTMLIEDMVCAKAAEKGQLSFEAIADAAHSYAREVEHSDLNLQRLSTMFRHQKCFHIGRLCGALLEW